jgi:alkyl hydroperoxide reductase subunit AhpC
MDLIVPAGKGTLDLPDIHLESLAWVKMLGKPSAEIEATDLEGNPVKLADYRGKVVLLIFWQPWRDAAWEVTRTLEPLIQFRKRFRDQSLAILLLHDASAPSIDAWKASEQPIFDWHHKQPDAPVRLLLDRPPIGIGTGRFGMRAGEPGSGRTADRYEMPVRASMIIDKEGKLAYVVVLQVMLGRMAIFSVAQNDELVQQIGSDVHHGHGHERSDSVASEAMLDDVRTILEDLLGLPRTAPPRSKRPSSPIDLPELRSPFEEPITSG